MKLTYHLFGRLIFCYIFAPPIKNNIVMARFILDVGNLEESNIKAICELVCDTLLNAEGSAKNDGIITINCIDKTNDNQFYSEFENGKTNELSAEQIENFKKVCNQ